MTQHPRLPPATGPRINQNISSPEVLLIDAQGERCGVVSRSRALEMAQAAQMDLVEVSPNEKPPVCKILDYGRLRYEAQKKKSELRRKQKISEVKEIQMRPGIEEHDYQVKLRNANRFLADGDRVKLTLQFRGRELTRKEAGLKVLERLEGDLAELAKVESPPKLEGKRMMMVFAPK